MRPGSSTFLVSAGSVAGLTTTTLLAGDAARVALMGAAKAVRLAASAAATPAAGSQRLPAFSRSSTVCSQILRRQVKTILAISVAPSSLGSHWPPRPV
jgi:peroxiredoxin